MKNILVLSAGTATAWNLCNAIREIGGSEVKLVACDTNPPWLVPASMISDVFLQVPPILSDGYYNYMISLLENHKIDILVPLIDWDLRYFARDSKKLIERGILSTAPFSETFESLSNKKNLQVTLDRIGIPSPRLYEVDEVDDDKEYFVKPATGFGSRNTSQRTGSEIKSGKMDGFIIQELCTPPEITADIFCTKEQISVLCRERIETKAGVCTKARIFYDEKLETCIKIIAERISLPECCCAQFMKNAAGELILTDFNLRLGAGSALSAAVGFCLAESAVAIWLDQKDQVSVEIPPTEHFVLRHYVELVTR